MVWTYRSAQGEAVQPAAECLTADEARHLQNGMKAQVYTTGTDHTFSLCPASRILPSLASCLKQCDPAKRQVKLLTAIEVCEKEALRVQLKGIKKDRLTYQDQVCADLTSSESLQSVHLPFLLQSAGCLSFVWRRAGELGTGPNLAPAESIFQPCTAQVAA